MFVKKNIVTKKIIYIASSFFNAFPNFLFLGIRLSLSLGKIFDIDYAFRSIKRYRWLQSKPFFIKEVTHSSLVATKDDVEIAQNIINQYKKDSTLSMYTEDSLWGEYNSIFTKEVEGLIKDNNKEHLAIYLNNLFQQPSVIGYSTGNLYNYTPHRRKFINIAIIEQIVSMAEFLGIIRVETIEQGIPQSYLRDNSGGFSEDKLISILDKIEENLKIDISFPRSCGSFGVEIGAYFLTVHSLGHLYRAIRIKDFIESNFLQPIKILEIGGGYGGLAYWLNVIAGSNISEYISADLPMTNIHSSFFLYKTKTPHKVICGKDINDVSDVDLVINEDSFAEMPVDEVNRYLEYITKNSLYFSSYNQEAYSPVNSILQVSVTEEAKKFEKHLKCISREKSWTRDGYIEQTYKVINMK